MQKINSVLYFPTKTSSGAVYIEFELEDSLDRDTVFNHFKEFVELQLRQHADSNGEVFVSCKDFFHHVRLHMELKFPQLRCNISEASFLSELKLPKERKGIFTHKYHLV